MRKFSTITRTSKQAGLLSRFNLLAKLMLFTVACGATSTMAFAANGTLVESGSVSETESKSEPQALPPGGAKTPAPRVPSTTELATLREAVENTPNSAKAHYNYAHALRAAGKQSQAVTEYLDASQLDPTLYVVYHELSLSKARPEQLDEAIERLKLLQEHRPNELLLCIALSELLEQKDELYPAAKVLNDLVYANTVPEKYLARVKARIHFLLIKNKEEQQLKKVQSEEPEADAAPLPLPESSLRRSLSASQLKDAKVMQNFGHSQLLP
jgi:hypothetical protein